MIKIVITIVITRSRESEHVHVHAVFHLELEVRVLLRVDFEWGEGHWAGLDVVSVLPFLLKLLGVPRLGGDHSVDLVQIVLPLLEHGHERLAEVLVVGRERRLWNHRALVWDGLRGLGAESTNRVSKQDKEGGNHATIEESVFSKSSIFPSFGGFSRHLSGLFTS